MKMNNINISVLADKLINSKWLLNQSAYQNLSKMVMSYMANNNADIELPEAEEVINDNSPYDTAIIDINGILVKGASDMECALFGLMNIDNIRYMLDDALADVNVTKIILNINSPGGEVTGIEELGRYILESNNIKPLYAWTETMACSAAYWLGSQCKNMGMSPSATVGSIGVYSLIEDNSKALEMEGINIQSIASGKYKMMGASFKPLTDEEKQILQDDVNNQHDKFKNAVNINRKISPEYMEGLSYEGRDALAGNLVDVVVDDITKYIDNTTSLSLTSQHIHTSMKTENTNIDKVAEAELPGVPIKETETTYYTECPHCGKKLSDPVEPHKEPDGDEVEPKDNKDEKKAVTLAPTPTAIAPEVKFDMSVENWNNSRGIASPITNAFVLSAYKTMKP